MTSENILDHPVTLELLLTDAAAQEQMLTAKFEDMAGSWWERCGGTVVNGSTRDAGDRLACAGGCRLRRLAGA